MRKKCWIAVPLIIIVVCLAACSGAQSSQQLLQHQADDDTGDSLSPTDFDNRFGRRFNNLVETEDAYYYCNFSGGYIYYYDKASGEHGVLCGKPECSHDSEMTNASCSGWIMLHANSLNYANGGLYYVAHLRSSDYVGPALFRMELDGTERKAVSRLDFGELTNTCWPQRFDMYRGKMYGYVSFERVETGEPKVVNCLTCVDTESGRTNIIYENDALNSSQFAHPFFYGRYVYFCFAYSSSAVPGVIYTTLEIMRWDTETETIEEVFKSEENAVAGDMFDIWVESESEIYLAPSIVSMGENTPVYRFNGKELQTAFEFENGAGAFLIGGGSVGFLHDSSAFEVRRFDGTLVRRIEPAFGFLEESEYDTVRDSVRPNGIYGDTDELFVVWQFRGGQGAPAFLTYVVRYDLATDDNEGELIAFTPWIK